MKSSVCSTAAVGKNKLLWVVEQDNPVLKDRRADLVMDSVINYYDRRDPRLSYEPGELFLDNGAFTASAKGVDLDRERVIRLQETLRPDLTIPLDYPLRANMSTKEMQRNWLRTRDNIAYWQSSTRLARKLVPALHSWDRKSLVDNIRWIQKHADSDYVALGSIVSPDFAVSGGFFGDRQPSKELVDMISLAISSVQKLSDFKVHLMGFGSSPLTLHLAYYLGADSTDSSGYRRKAAYGKIVLRGTGERYVGNDSASFGTTKFAENDEEDIRDKFLLDNCTCPICRMNKDVLWIDWRSRAIHNEYVMKQEAATARRFSSVGDEVYEKYLDRAVFADSSLRYLWEYAKLRRRYYRISDVLFDEEV